MEQKLPAFLLSALVVVMLVAVCGYGYVDPEQGQDYSVYGGGETGDEFYGAKVPCFFSGKGSGPNYSGYIVEFVGEPLVKERLRLEDEARKNSENVLDKIPLIREIYRAFVLTPGKVQASFADYSRAAIARHDMVRENVLKKVSKSGKTVTGNYYKLFNGVAMDISDEEAEQIRDVPGVKKVWSDMEVHALLYDSVPLIQGGIAAGKLDEDGNDCIVSGKTCLDGSGVKIAVIDTGVDYTHPDLGGCFGQGCKVAGGWDFVNNDADPMDDQGHGTHCAATAAGNGVLKGVAPGAKIYAYKVLNNRGSGSFSNVIAGIERAVDPNQDGDFSDRADVISMSLGGQCGGYSGDCGPDDVVSQAVDNAVSAGVVAVVAAGNSGPGEGTIGTPGTARKAITVGASDKSDGLAEFSSRGPVIWEDENGVGNVIIKPDITAPGVSICAAQASNKPWNDKLCFDDKHVAISGTSMATPHVAGAVALIKQKNPEWTPSEIKLALRSTAVDLNHEITIQGYGRIDVSGAVNSGKPVITEIKNNGLLNGNVKIIGTVGGNNVRNWVLELGEGLNPTSWVSINEGNTQVVNDFLGSLDTTVLNDGKYTLRLTATDYSGKTSEDKTIVKIFNDPNFEIIGDVGFASNWGGIAVGDINGDKIQEIIAVDYDPTGMADALRIWALSSGGKVLEGWPKEVDYWNSNIGHIVLSTPALADIDKDGINEIILVGGSEFYAFNFDGSNVNGFPLDIQSSEGDPLHSIRFPQFSVGDVDDDDQLEIISVGSLPSESINGTKVLHVAELFIIENDGSIKAGFPRDLNGIPNSAPAIADINNDGINEIIVSLIGCVNYTCGNSGSKIVVVNGNGDMIPGWPVLFNRSTLVKSPVIGDFDSDADKEVIIVSPFSEEGLPQWRQIILSGNGTIENEDILLNGYASGYFDFSVADFGNDGFLDIISRDGGILASVNNRNKRNVNFSSSPPTYSIIGDVNSDNLKDILIWNKDDLFILNENLDVESRKTISDFSNIIGIALTDLENNSKLDIIGVSNNGKIFVWRNVADYNSSAMDWPMFRHDLQQTGCYDCLDSVAECTPEKEYSSSIKPCCAGLVGFNTPNNLSLCYNLSKGVPVCRSIGTRSEGWYYSKSNELIRYENCGVACTLNCTGKQCGSDGCGGSCGNCSAGMCNATGQCFYGYNPPPNCPIYSPPYCPNGTIIPGKVNPQTGCRGPPMCDSGSGNVSAVRPI